MNYYKNIKIKINFKFKNKKMIKNWAFKLDQNNSMILMIIYKKRFK
jgi:hypothetical protein